VALAILPMRSRVLKTVRGYLPTVAAGTVFGLLLMFAIWSIWPERLIPEEYQKKPLRNLQLARELLGNAGEFQLGAMSSLDQKAATLLATTAVLLGFGVVQHAQQALDGTPLYAALVLLLLGLVSGWIVLIPRRLAYPILEKPFLEGDYRKAKMEPVLLHAVKVLDRIIRINDKQRQRKEGWVKWQFWFLLAGAALLAASYGLRTVGF
jgi:hypothetical protein